MARNTRHRTALLGRCEELLTFFAVTLRYTALPLSALTDRAAARSEFADLPFLLRWRELPPGAFHDRWEKAVSSCGELPDAARELLLSFGADLGDGDTEGQLRYIALYTERLHGLYSEAEKDTDRRARLYRSLGVLGGGALALLCL